jgi:serine/threonine protein kinase
MVEMSSTSDLVVGGCRLESVIGRGGMGTVYRATQLALGRDVAVKVVPAQGVETGVIERFQREARTGCCIW